MRRPTAVAAVTWVVWRSHSIMLLVVGNAHETDDVEALMGELFGGQ